MIDEEAAEQWRLNKAEQMLWLSEEEATSPDHAPWEPFSHMFGVGARDRSDQLIGATPLTMQRVWG